MLLPGGFGLATARTLIDPGSAIHAGVNMSRILQHGKQIFQKIFFKQKVKVDQIKQIDRCKREVFVYNEQYRIAENARPFAKYLQRFGIRTLASELRRKAAFQFRNGHVPTFAFAFGLVVSQNQHDNDDVSAEIREIFKGSDVQPTCFFNKVQKLSLNVIDFGNQIGQGCNAAVFEARISECDESSDSDIDILSDSESVMSENSDSESDHEELRFVFEHFSQEVAPNADASDVVLLDSDDDIVIVPISADHQTGPEEMMTLPVSDGVSTDHQTDPEEMMTLPVSDGVSTDHQTDPEEMMTLPVSDGVSTDHQTDPEEMMTLPVSDGVSTDHQTGPEEMMTLPVSDGVSTDHQTDPEEMMTLPVSDGVSTDHQTDPEEMMTLPVSDGLSTDHQTDPEEMMTLPVSDGLSTDHQTDPEEMMTIPVSDGLSTDGVCSDSGTSRDTIKMKEDNHYDLAVKMMFNYGVESNAQKIAQVMEKEIVPAQSFDIGCNTWHNSNKVRLKTLPPHHNIVEMAGMFVDSVPSDLQEAARENFPHALPPRLNPEGLGRNMTMFIIMKKYDCTLREYLNQNDLSTMSRCNLLLQLLEGVVHLTNHQVAHRDLKSNNILIHGSGSDVQLVISDFGCCHADPEYGMKLPYFTRDTDRGGNPALMAPEISSACAGCGVWLDYSKSDLWTVGTLVYEIFGMENPFSRRREPMKSETYTDDDLPALPDDVPETIKTLTAQLLRRNPSQRPSAVVAANTVYLCMQFPDWFMSKCKPTDSVVTESLLLLITEKIFAKSAKKNNSGISEDLLNMFLKRVNRNEIMKILYWFHCNTE